MACTHENVFVHGEMGDFQWCKDCGSTRFVEDGDVWDPPKHSQLLQFLRRRLRQTMQDGFELPLLEMDRHAMSRDAVRGGHKIIARGQMDIFAEIIRYLHTELGMSGKHAPYVLQAWVDGVYHYYAKTEWVPSVEFARTFQALTEAEAFIMQNFNPDVARDSILIVPLKEALER